MQKPYKKHKTSARISALRSLLTYNYMNTRFKPKHIFQTPNFKSRLYFKNFSNQGIYILRTIFGCMKIFQIKIFSNPKHKNTTLVNIFQFFNYTHQQRANTSKTHFETNPKSPDSWPNNHIHTQNPLVFPDPNRNQQVLEPNHRIKQKLKTNQERNNSLKEHDEQFKHTKFELGKIKLISPANLNPEKSKP